MNAQIFTGFLGCRTTGLEPSVQPDGIGRRRAEYDLKMIRTLILRRMSEMTRVEYCPTVPCCCGVLICQLNRFGWIKFMAGTDTMLL